MSRPSALLTALAAGLAAGIGYPYVELALACRVPDAEACVWGKAYFSLTFSVSLILVGGLVTGLVYVLLRWLNHADH